MNFEEFLAGYLDGARIFGSVSSEDVEIEIAIGESQAVRDEAEAVCRAFFTKHQQALARSYASAKFPEFAAGLDFFARQGATPRRSFPKPLAKEATALGKVNYAVDGEEILQL